MKRILGMVLVVLAAVALVCSPVMAADKAAAPAKAEKAVKVAKKAKKEPVTVVGMVSEVKNKKGKVIGATIQADNYTYTVVRKGKGADVAKLVGKKVEVKGTVSEKKGKKYFYVKEYKEAM